MGKYSVTYNYKSNIEQVWEDLIWVNEKEIMQGLYLLHSDDQKYYSQNGLASMAIEEKVELKRVKYFLENSNSSCTMEFDLKSNGEGTVVALTLELNAKSMFLKPLSGTYAKKMADDILAELRHELIEDI